jgi:hypothetical protein
LNWAVLRRVRVLEKMLTTEQECDGKAEELTELLRQYEESMKPIRERNLRTRRVRL